MTGLRFKFLAVVMMFSGVVNIASADLKTGKVIGWGQDVPNPVYIKDNIDEMHKIPFDGLVLSPTANDRHDTSKSENRQRVFGARCWGPQCISAKEYSESIEAMRSTKWGRFTDNFMRFNVTPGNVDWFNENFSSVVANAGLAAKIAKECGLKGIVFDTEQYHGHPFEYKPGSEQSLADYQKQVRKRGREFMTAMNKEYPDITILMTFGYYTGQKKSLYGLLPAFLDGMLDAASEKTMIYDGWESSYGYKSQSAYKEALDNIHQKSLEMSGSPEKFKKHYRASFGIWVDNGRKFDTDFTKNHFTPQEFAHAVNLALKNTDKYVWIWSERAKWWKGRATPAYVQALIDGRKENLKAPTETASQAKKRYASLAERKGRNADDNSIFEGLTDRYSEIMTLPIAGWKFMLDPDEIGEQQKWFLPELKDTNWKSIQISQWWEPQGYSYDGFAWYRRWVEIPSSAADKKLLLVFGAVDESAWVYVNGQLAGVFDMDDLGWNKRFEIDVTKFMKPGQKNLVAIKVFDRSNCGGIWKPVKLMTPKK